MELQGKTAVITGGASGIGLATARQFASSGANLVLGDIEEAPLQTALESLRADGAHVIGVLGDVSVEGDVMALRDAAVAEFGANLVGAHLEGAHLFGAHLEGAYLFGAQGLTQAQAMEARGDKNTRLPSGLAHPWTGGPWV